MIIPCTKNNVHILVTVNNNNLEKVVFKLKHKQHNYCDYDRFLKETSMFYAKLDERKKGYSTIKLFLLEQKMIKLEQIDVQVTYGDESKTFINSKYITILVLLFLNFKFYCGKCFLQKYLNNFPVICTKISCTLYKSYSKKTLF